MLQNKGNFNLQQHIYIRCYSEQNNTKHAYNSPASQGREFAVFHFNLPDGKAQVKTEWRVESGEWRHCRRGLCSLRAEMRPISSHSITGVGVGWGRATARSLRSLRVGAPGTDFIPYRYDSYVQNYCGRAETINLSPRRYLVYGR